MLRWIDDQRFVIGQTTFLTTGDKDWNDTRFRTFFMSAVSRADRFVVCKSRTSIDRYVELVRQLSAKNIVELGIMKGGSTAFFAEIAQPKMMVAVDITRDRVEALEEFLEQQDLAKRVKAYYGVDQADQVALRAILDKEFANAPLDLVVDDASHRLDATRAAFNALFPRLRPGGVYVIEDWSWAHAFHGADLGNIGPPLTNLVFEIIVACATLRDLIDSIQVDWGSAFVTRGAGPIEGAFDIAEPMTIARAEGTAALPG